MFNKPNSSPNADGRAEVDEPAFEPPARRAGPRAASLISSDMRIEGSVSCEGELQVDGVVKGDIKVARLTIGEHGKIEGAVVADSVDCRGGVNGSITAKQVRLHASSHVDGDISHEQLAMEAGAYFQGKSLRLKRAPAQATTIPSTSASPAADKPAPSPPAAGSGLGVPPSPAAKAN